MSNTILSRPLRPLSSSISACLVRSSSAASTVPGIGSTAAAIPTSSSSLSSGISSHGHSSSTGITAPGLTQRRYAATTRRHNKALKSVPSAPLFGSNGNSPHTGGVEADNTSASTILYNPPSAAPSVYHTPLKFLPAGDRRRQLAAVQARVAAQQIAAGQSPVMRTGTQLSAASGYDRYSMTNSNSSTTSTAAGGTSQGQQQKTVRLPPPLRQPYDKKYHLTASDIAEIRRLRASDPATWTRQKLADKFECSQFFVGLVAPAPEHAQRKADEVEEVKRRWGPRRRAAREERKKRREGWGRAL